MYLCKVLRKCRLHMPHTYVLCCYYARLQSGFYVPPIQRKRNTLPHLHGKAFGQGSGFELLLFIILWELTSVLSSLFSMCLCWFTFFCWVPFKLCVDRLKKKIIFFFKIYSLILVTICLIILKNISTSLIAGPKWVSCHIKDQGEYARRSKTIWKGRSTRSSRLLYAVTWPPPIPTLPYELALSAPYRTCDMAMGLTSPSSPAAEDVSKLGKEG